MVKCTIHLKCLIHKVNIKKTSIYHNTLKNFIHNTHMQPKKGIWCQCVGIEIFEKKYLTLWHFQDCTKNIFYRCKMYGSYFSSFHSYWDWGNYYRMHKITVPPLQPSTYYESQYHLTAIYQHCNASLLFCTLQQLKIPFFLTQQCALQHSGNNGICESTGSVEFTLSLPEPYHCTSHDADCYGSIHVSLLQTDCYTGTDCCPWLYKAKQSNMERYSTRR